MTARISPSLDLNVSAMRETSAGGGLSATKRHATSMNLFSENDFRIGIVDAFVKFELRIFARLLNGPASETTSDFGDVLLRVATVNAEGVKLHQLATVIFVQPTFLFLFVLSLRILRRQGPGKTVPGTAHLLAPGTLLRLTLTRAGISTHEIIQIEKHGRALRGVGHQILELSEDVGLEYIAFVGGEVVAVFALSREHV